jgi:hypothetical protein
MLVILAFLGGAIIGALALAVVSEDDNFEQLGHIDELSADGGDLIPPTAKTPKRLIESLSF